MRQPLWVRLGIFVFLAMVPFSGCRQLGGQGVSSVSVSAYVDGMNAPQPQNSRGVSPEKGLACQGSDSSRYCLALKYVVYKDPSGKPVVPLESAKATVRQINSVWAQCGIGFGIEKYIAVNPVDYGLVYQTARLSELTAIRSKFADDNTLLVVTTGTWNRAGSLGNSKANAWTTLPGDNPYGIVVERPEGGNANLIAHELGHYLNLLHVEDKYALMNAIIYSFSTSIYSSPCKMARSAVSNYWSDMVR